jgi:hypothetical protein
LKKSVDKDAHIIIQRALVEKYCPKLTQKLVARYQNIDRLAGWKRSGKSKAKVAKAERCALHKAQIEARLQPGVTFSSYLRAMLMDPDSIDYRPRQFPRHIARLLAGRQIQIEKRKGPFRGRPMIGSFRNICWLFKGLPRGAMIHPKDVTFIRKWYAVFRGENAEILGDEGLVWDNECLVWVSKRGHTVIEVHMLRPPVKW